jgi:hypothetical protein
MSAACIHVMNLEKAAFFCWGREPMSVAVETLFTSALGLQPPWVV